MQIIHDFSSLPTPVKQNVFSFLHFKEIARNQRICKEAKRVIDNMPLRLIPSVHFPLKRLPRVTAECKIFHAVYERFIQLSDLKQEITRLNFLNISKGSPIEKIKEGTQDIMGVPFFLEYADKTYGDDLYFLDDLFIAFCDQTPTEGFMKWMTEKSIESLIGLIRFILRDREKAELFIAKLKELNEYQNFVKELNKYPYFQGKDPLDDIFSKIDRNPPLINAMQMNNPMDAIDPTTNDDDKEFVSLVKIAVKMGSNCEDIILTKLTENALRYVCTKRGNLMPLNYEDDRENVFKVIGRNPYQINRIPEDQRGPDLLFHALDHIPDQWNGWEKDMYSETDFSKNQLKRMLYGKAHAIFLSKLLPNPFKNDFHFMLEVCLNYGLCCVHAASEELQDNEHFIEKIINRFGPYKGEQSRILIHHFFEGYDKNRPNIQYYIKYEMSKI